MSAFQESQLARWRGILRLSRRQLQQRWLESLFILLGIALGVGVFTGMETYLRFGSGMEQEAAKMYPETGAIRITARRIDYSSLMESAAIRLTETMEEPVELDFSDVLTLREAVPGIGQSLLGMDWRSESVTAVDGESVVAPDGADAARIQLNIQSFTPDDLSLRERRFLAGASFTWDDLINEEKRVVIEEETAREYFPDLDPHEVVGHTLTTTWGPQGVQWQIVGVLERQDNPLEALMFFGTETKMLMIYAPPDLKRELRQFYVLPKDADGMDRLVGEVQAYFDQVYEPGRVAVVKPYDYSDFRFAVPLLAMAGLALLIAAVNILNLFTARVLRRQRYTGMSVALGATRTMLFLQTSGEALLLGIMGSAVGLAFASGIVRLLRMLIETQMQVIEMGFNPLEDLGLTPIDAMIGLVLGTSISLVFGLYPAWLASRQQPAEALRTE